MTDNIFSMSGSSRDMKHIFSYEGILSQVPYAYFESTIVLGYTMIGF